PRSKNPKRETNAEFLGEDHFEVFCRWGIKKKPHHRNHLRPKPKEKKNCKAVLCCNKSNSREERNRRIFAFFKHYAVPSDVN
ncbi:MAG: hypothetical protein AB7E52_01370, partial [Bdellovibrionales bacterium]